jgi:hypothetical protein
VASLLAPAAILAGDCDVDVSAQLEHKEKNMDTTRLEFRVEIESRSDCAKILYDLIIEEQLPNGQTKKIRKPTVQKLGNDSISSVHRHEMPASHDLVGYEAKVVSCEPCDATP